MYTCTCLMYKLDGKYKKAYFIYNVQNAFTFILLL